MSVLVMCCGFQKRSSPRGACLVVVNEFVSSLPLPWLAFKVVVY